MGTVFRPKFGKISEHTLAANRFLEWLDKSNLNNDFIRQDAIVTGVGFHADESMDKVQWTDHYFVLRPSNPSTRYDVAEVKRVGGTVTELNVVANRAKAEDAALLVLNSNELLRSHYSPNDASTTGIGGCFIESGSVQLLALVLGRPSSQGGDPIAPLLAR